jgi:hypothetical protein
MISSAPDLDWGTNPDDHVGQRWSDGRTTLDLSLGARDDVTSPLTVFAASPPAYRWNFSYDGGRYSYQSAGNEGLSSGPHTLTITVQDGAAPPNAITFQRNVFIFDASPNLVSPANAALGVSTTPTFEWSYGGSLQPWVYILQVYDDPGMDSGSLVWQQILLGSGGASVTIPADKQLAPAKTYYWYVMGVNDQFNGQTFSAPRSFTTGGPPLPETRFEFAYVRSDDLYPPPNLQTNAMIKVLGPGPADVAELKVTGPGGVRYLFTEDDLQVSEQVGEYYSRNFPAVAPNGTYTFSLTDAAGRTFTTSRDFVYAAAPRVDFATMAPADNAYVGTTTPTLSWTSAGGGSYYRVVITDWNTIQSPVYQSDFTPGTQITVPPGHLFPNAPYKWRVDVYDAVFGNNRARSNTLRFSTGTYLYTPNINWGSVWNDNNYYSGMQLVLGLNVFDVLPNQVTQASVSWTGGAMQFSGSNISYPLNVPQGFFYSNGQTGTAPDGVYNFNLQTPLGNDQWSKEQTSTTIPIVEHTSLSPANGAYLSTLTPTLTWAAVAGSPRYYRVQINDWRARYAVYSSPRSADLSAVIPVGALKPNRSYKWRVEVFDDADGTVADNRSSSIWNSFTTPGAKASTNFNGDGMTDVAAFHHPSDQFFTDYAGNLGQYGWGGPDCYPLIWDHNGDGITDVSIYHIPTNQWFVKGYPGDNMGQFGWGEEDCIPVPGNYDGIGGMERAFYHTPSNTFFIETQGGPPLQIQFGWNGAECVPVPGDYDGDGKTDLMIYHIPSNQWLMYGAGNQGQYGWNGPECIPVPGDYDGDGSTDIAVYHYPSNQWFVKGYPGDNLGQYGWGGLESFPIPGDYNGDGVTEKGFYRYDQNWWFLEGQGDFGWGWGGADFIPITSQINVFNWFRFWLGRFQ